MDFYYPGTKRELKNYLKWKKKNYLGINLNKDVQDIYGENKTLLKDIKEVLNKWRDTSCLWIEKTHHNDVNFPQLNLYIQYNYNKNT